MKLAEFQPPGSDQDFHFVLAIAGSTGSGETGSFRPLVTGPVSI